MHRGPSNKQEQGLGPETRKRCSWPAYGLGCRILAQPTWSMAALTSPPTFEIRKFTSLQQVEPWGRRQGSVQYMIPKAFLLLKRQAAEQHACSWHPSPGAMSKLMIPPSQQATH